MFTKQIMVIQCHFASAGNEIFNDNIQDKINVENLAVAESDTGAAIVRAGWLVSAEHVAAAQGFGCSGPATAVLFS